MRAILASLIMLVAGCSEKTPVVEGNEQAVIDKAEADMAAAEAAAAK